MAQKMKRDPIWVYQFYPEPGPKCIGLRYIVLVPPEHGWYRKTARTIDKVRKALDLPFEVVWAGKLDAKGIAQHSPPATSMDRMADSQRPNVSSQYWAFTIEAAMTDAMNADTEATMREFREEASLLAGAGEAMPKPKEAE